MARGILLDALPPAARRRLALRPLLLAAAWVSGCTDTRISVNALRQLEHQIERETASSALPQIQPEQLALAEKKPVTIQPRDVLTIDMNSVAAGPSLVRARVDGDGFIRMPLVGSVKVGGLDLASVERVIHEAHVPKYVADMTVFVDIPVPEVTTVLVSGAATLRGLVALKSNERNVLYALALGGGYGAGSSGRVRVRPVDPAKPEAVYNLNRVDDVRRAMLSEPLASGDMLLVESASPDESTVYVQGLVNGPGPIALPPDARMPLSRVVAAAGGLKDFLDPREATLWRRMADGEKVRVKVNLGAILAGKEPDIDLVAGDLLDVGHTWETRARDWVLQNIRIGPFGIGAHWDPVAELRFQQALGDGGGYGTGAGRGSTGFGNSVLDTIRFGLPNVIVPPVLPPTTPTTP